MGSKALRENEKLTLPQMCKVFVPWRLMNAHWRTARWSTGLLVLTRDRAMLLIGSGPVK